MKMAKKQNKTILPNGSMPRYRIDSFRIVFLYAFFGILWILFSDRAVELLSTDLRIQHYVQTLKGGFFVGITSLLLYVLIKNNLKKHHALLGRYSDTILQKEFLLRELNHRVKNNFQTITSLLTMEKEAAGKESPQNARIERLILRVHSVAAIHEKLAHADKISAICLSEYINGILDDYSTVYGVEKNGVMLKRDIDNINVTYDLAVDIGMIISELLLNSIKYGIAGQDDPCILVSVGHDERMIRIVVENNGPAYKPDASRDSSLGLNIVHGLVEKYNGSMEIVPSEGTRTEIALFHTPGKDGAARIIR